MDKGDIVQQPKISAEFRKRLKRLKPKDKVTVIVVLAMNGAASSKGKRQTDTERFATLDATRKSMQPALMDIDSILTRFGGRRLADNVDALGSVAIESTPAGIKALAASEHVRVILQDQPINLLSTPSL